MPLGEWIRCRRSKERARRRRARNRAPQAALSGNNGSAFFFRLLSRAKSAMAEILVSDLCDCRPPLLIGGLFHCHPTRVQHRRPVLRRPTEHQRSPGFSDCSDCSAHCFFALFVIVLAPAHFLKSSQSLALYLARIFHCRSIVFFRKFFWTAHLHPSRARAGPRPDAIDNP